MNPASDKGSVSALIRPPVGPAGVAGATATAAGCGDAGVASRPGSESCWASGRALGGAASLLAGKLWSSTMRRPAGGSAGRAPGACDGVTGSPGGTRGVTGSGGGSSGVTRSGGTDDGTGTSTGAGGGWVGA